MQPMCSQGLGAAMFVAAWDLTNSVLCVLGQLSVLASDMHRPHCACYHGGRLCFVCNADHCCWTTNLIVRAQHAGTFLMLAGISVQAFILAVSSPPPALRACMCGAGSAGCYSAGCAHMARSSSKQARQTQKYVLSAKRAHAHSAST